MSTTPRCADVRCQHARRVHFNGYCDHIRQSCEDIGCEAIACKVALCPCRSYREPWQVGGSHE